MLTLLTFLAIVFSPDNYPGSGLEKGMFILVIGIIELVITVQISKFYKPEIT